MEYWREVFTPSAMGLIIGAAIGIGLPIFNEWLKVIHGRSEAIKAQRLQTTTELLAGISEFRKAINLDAFERQDKQDEQAAKGRDPFASATHEVEARTRMHSIWNRFVLQSRNLSKDFSKRSTESKELSETFELILETIRIAGTPGVAVLPSMLSAWVRRGRIDFKELKLVREELSKQMKETRK